MEHNATRALGKRFEVKILLDEVGADKEEEKEKEEKDNREKQEKDEIDGENIYI